MVGWDFKGGFQRESAESWLALLIHLCLVGGFNPSEKYARHLGWWHFQLMEKLKFHGSSHHQPVTYLKTTSWLRLSKLFGNDSPIPMVTAVSSSEPSNNGAIWACTVASWRVEIWVVPLSFWLHPNHPKFWKTLVRFPAKNSASRNVSHVKTVPWNRSNRLDAVLFPQRWTLTPQKYSEIDILWYQIYIGCWKLLHWIILSQKKISHSASVSLVFQKSQAIAFSETVLHFHRDAWFGWLNMINTDQCFHGFHVWFPVNAMTSFISAGTIHSRFSHGVRDDDSKLWYQFTIPTHQSCLPSGKHTKNYGKIHHVLAGNSTISTGPFSMSQTVNVYQAG